jgi:flagellar protein FliO/FliZ
MLSTLTRKLAPAFLVSLVGSLPLSVSVWAAPGNANGDVPDDFIGSGLESFYMILKVIGVLVIIIGIFFVLIRLLARRNQSAAFGRPVRSIGGVPLGQNKSLQIVTIGKSLYIVGVGDNVQLLDKIEDEETVAELTELMAGGGGSMPELMSMGKWLKRLRERQKPMEEEELATTSFGHLFQEKLQQIANSKKRTQELLQQPDEERFDPK